MIIMSLPVIISVLSVSLFFIILSKKRVGRSDIKLSSPAHGNTSQQYKGQGGLLKAICYGSL